MKKLTVDPGIIGTGYAVWARDWSLISWGQIQPRKDRTLEQRSSLILSTLKMLIMKYTAMELYIEYPAVFSGKLGIAIAKRGDIVKLAFVTGIICGISWKRFNLVPVNKWKGQLPKEVVKKRINKIFPNYVLKDHEYDAVGLGLYLRGDL